MLKSFLTKIQYRLPWTYPAEIRGLIPKGSTVLDVGCGNGHNMAWVNAYGDYKVTGIDINKKDLAIAKKRKCYIEKNKPVYEKLVIADLTKKTTFKKKFDVVVSSQLVEHLEKKDAFALIKKMEKWASKKIIVATINGFFQFNHREVGEHDVHRSGWTTREFKMMGYEVIGSGLRFVYKPGALKDRLSDILTPLLFLISYVLTPIIRVLHPMALLLISYKDIK